MEPRITNPALTVPGAMQALQALGKAAHASGLPHELLELVNMRASQINGCGVCIHMHGRDLKQGGASDERVFGVAAWRDAPFYSPAERAAFALTEAMTRLADREEAVSDEVWNDAAAQFDEAQLSALVLAIANINVWNRINAATRQVAGSF